MTAIAPHREYIDRLAAGEVPFQRCTACQAAVFFPRILCPQCGSTRLNWCPSAGLGTVYSVSVLSPRDALPYPVALVDLDEGFRMMSTVVGIPAEDVRIGMRVRARVDQTGPRVEFTVLEGRS
ncbi:hypothetical protein Aple_000150 [Acrocarpospora pleiomorpha]|uniref:DNA-binding protein n=1 Tax=Acrocarpospora pleiomorpha TaxID=90975 RepID=A0A5M3X7Q5_9ACTN|nr:OB-fold domain-containing protein [Acrocarpospora pleiomorpha]GES17120.1 hypothetical protein Aple_000150 [Acrocarpospora pleiomorpha]